YRRGGRIRIGHGDQSRRLGTSSFPEETFWPAHNKMLKTLEGENITFAAIHIDRHFPEDNSPNRKPGIGMLGQYFDPSYDLAGSYVIGDRITDIQLAANLGAKAIFIGSEEAVKDLDENLRNALALVTTDWDEIYEKVKLPERRAQIERNT